MVRVLAITILTAILTGCGMVDTWRAIEAAREQYSAHRCSTYPWNVRNPDLAESWYGRRPAQEWPAECIQANAVLRDGGGNNPSYFEPVVVVDAETGRWRYVNVPKGRQVVGAVQVPGRGYTLGVTVVRPDGGYRVVRVPSGSTVVAE